MALELSGLPPGLEAYDPDGNTQTVGMLHEYDFNSDTGSGVPDAGVCATIGDGSLVMKFKQPGRILKDEGGLTRGTGDMINLNGNTCHDATHIRFSGVYRRAGV